MLSGRGEAQRPWGQAFGDCRWVPPDVMSHLERSGHGHDPLSSDFGQQSGCQHHELYGVVRDHLLDLHRDPVGVCDRHDRRDLSGVHGGFRVLAGLDRRPQFQAHSDDGIEPCLVSFLCRGAGDAAGRARGRVHRSVRPLSVGVRPAGHARRDRGQYPLDCAADAGDHHDRRGRARQGKRAGGDGDRHRVFDHFGDLGVPCCLGRDVAGAYPGAGVHDTGVRSSGISAGQ